jgi:cytoskeletal protein CcmA (bactofilin family)
VGLFGGKPETTPTVNTAPPAREKRETAPVQAAGAPTVIGKDAHVKGELRSSADMLIEGRVEGEVHGTRVTVGESGEVHARVSAQVLVVRGTVHGDCEGSKKVEITASGRVFGNIASRAIVVAEGATFRGASKMAQLEPVKADDRPGTVPESSSTPGGAESENVSSTHPN